MLIHVITCKSWSCDLSQTQQVDNRENGSKICAKAMPHWNDRPGIELPRSVLFHMSPTRKKSLKRRDDSKNQRWSARVTKHSNALDLESKIFKSTNPRRIARSLKRSAQASKRRKGTPYQSAMSMLNFYINRAGKSLSQKQKRVLERAKDELRDVFGRA